MSGLDDLVAEAMSRKLIEPPPSPAVSSESVPVEVTPEAEMPDVLSKAVTWKDETSNSNIANAPDTSRAPDVSLAFAVNGVKCIVTIHVESGAKVTTPTTPKPSRATGGVKVKGIRGAKTEEVEAPEPSEEGFDKKQPIGSDNLPEGWVYDEVVGATPSIPARERNDEPAWLCPEHGKSEERLSNITGRTFTVCPECGRLAPK